MDTTSLAPARKVVTRAPGRTVRRINLPGIFDAPIECESSLERDFVIRAALCPGVAQMRHQPFQLTLESGRNYTPDFLVKGTWGAHRVVEVKMSDRVADYRDIFDQAKEKLVARGIEFLVLTEEHIRRNRGHEQAALLLRYSKTSIAPAVRECLLSCIEGHRQGATVAVLLDQSGATLTDVLHLVGSRQLNISSCLSFTKDSLVFPRCKEAYHEVRIENWFDAPLW